MQGGKGCTEQRKGENSRFVLHRRQDTMLFSFEGGDANSSIIWRCTHRSRSDIGLDQFSQVLRGRANDDLPAETRTSLFNSLLYEKPAQLLDKKFGVCYSTRFKDEFGCRVLDLLEWFDDLIKQLLRMHLWWSLCTLYLHAYQVRVTVGDSGLCCTCVAYFER